MLSYPYSAKGDSLMSVRVSRGRSRVTKDIEVAVVQTLRDTDIPMTEIAKMYGISGSTVSKINSEYNADGQKLETAKSAENANPQAELEGLPAQDAGELAGIPPETSAGI